MKFEVWQNKGGSWCWHLKAKNGEIIATGEAYVSRSSVLHAINLVVETTGHTPVNEIVK